MKHEAFPTVPGEGLSLKLLGGLDEFAYQKDI